MGVYVISLDVFETVSSVFVKGLKNKLLDRISFRAFLIRICLTLSVKEELAELKDNPV